MGLRRRECPHCSRKARVIMSVRFSELVHRTLEEPRSADELASQVDLKRSGGSDAEVSSGTGCPSRRGHFGCDACCAVPATPAGMVSREWLSDARQDQHRYLCCASPRDGEKGLVSLAIQGALLRTDA